MAESDANYREQAEATIADLRARVSHYEALLVAVRDETFTTAAGLAETCETGTHAAQVIRFTQRSLSAARIIPPATSGGEDRA